MSVRGTPWQRTVQDRRGPGTSGAIGCSCARIAAGNERFDAHHVSATAAGALPQRRTGESLVPITVIRVLERCRGVRLRRVQESSAGGEFGLAVAVTQKAVAADVLKAAGQHMQ